MKQILLGLAGCLTMLLVGCGPIKSTQIIVEADTALHNAKTAEAHLKSPYEFTAAELYLHKAREKWGTSKFEYSVDYATISRDLAVKAKERAQQAP